MKTKFKINILECLRKDDEMNQYLANERGESNPFIMYRCAQNTNERDFLISLGWRFNGIEKNGRIEVYRMNKMFTKNNNN